MSLEEYGRLLNLLLECERAGAKLLTAYCDELPEDSEGSTRAAAADHYDSHLANILLCEEPALNRRYHPARA